MKLIYHPLILDDVRQIINYYRKTYGKSTANFVGRQLKSDVVYLLLHPTLGHIEEELNDLGDPIVYRTLLSGPTKIVYTVHDDCVFIHALWNTHREPTDF